MMRTILTVLLMAAVFFMVSTTTWAQDDKGCEAPKCECIDCPDYPCCECRKAKPDPCPAKYNNRRFLENWRPCLCVPKCDRGDWSDWYKAYPLTRNKSIWVDVGGQVRARWESFGNIGFGAPADPHDTWMLFRARAHADVHFGNHFRLFAEGIYANQWENRELGPRPVDRNLGDLLNLFVEGKVDGGFGEGGLWVGRRELQTAKQRLVSPLDWSNTRRTFQGIGGWWSKGFHKVDAWVTNPVVIDHDDWDDVNEDVAFWGAEYTNSTRTCMTWGAYLYGLNNDTARDENRYTVGARVDGKIPNTRFDYDTEAAYQFGDQAGNDVSAWMFSGTFGWKPCTACGDPRLGVGFDYASGDSDPTDGTVGTFNQLFPLAHKYLGHADILARQNLVAARVEGSYKLFDKLTFKGWFHAFWRADTNDAAYGVTGGVLRPAGGNSDSELGTELDLMLAYKIDRHWTAFVEWAHFFTGSFIDNTGAHKDVDVWYLSIQGTF
ncbi:MAG: alginate export family protein [Planctomycetota bacterium]|nr:alginate export family protein [Planctomycetota bacterium]